MSEKRQHFLNAYDWIWKGLMFETPAAFKYLKAAGVILKTNEEVLDVVSSIVKFPKLKTLKDTYKADEMVLGVASFQRK